MLYFDHYMCRVRQNAIHTVDIASHLQVLKQANKILLQCTVHTPRCFKLNLEVSQTIQTKKYLVLANWKQTKKEQKWNPPHIMHKLDVIKSQILDHICR